MRHRFPGNMISQLIVRCELASVPVPTPSDRAPTSRVRPQSGGEDSGGGGGGGSDWRCVCVSADDWRQLADSYSGSRSPLELELYHTLKEDFLPEIPRLFAQKQKLQVSRDGARGCWAAGGVTEVSFLLVTFVNCIVK